MAETLCTGQWLHFALMLSWNRCVTDSVYQTVVRATRTSSFATSRKTLGR
jgi:hypothetical protein